MASNQTVKLAEYLFSRLHQLGIRSVFGVPGDYNLELLDYVEPSGLHWVGNCNELTAGYAADGYARVKGLSALITTYGVGELSAINAIAGAFAEKSPVVHIVGSPSRPMQDARVLMHHTLNDGEYRRFAHMHAYVTTAQVNLTDPRTSPAQIDFALEQCLLKSRPVYIEVPLDMVTVPVVSTNLRSAITIDHTLGATDSALAAILERIYSCKKPMILVDGEIRSFGAIELVNQLVKRTAWPTWTTAFSKGFVDESLDNSLGIHGGKYNPQDVKEYIDSCDLVLFLGPHLSDTNTYLFSSIPDPSVTISFNATEVQVGSITYRDLPAKSFLGLILEKLESSKIPAAAPYPKRDRLTSYASFPASLNESQMVTQEHLWKIFSAFLKPGDVVLAETGTASHGTREFVLPPSTRYFGPATWLSIGHMLPAALGVAMAQRELIREGSKEVLPQTRTLLFVGEGSLQVTVQALSEVIREGLDMLIFIINNNGYTIERCIHGRAQAYNDVAAWRYLQAPAFFGAAPDASHTYDVANWGDLKALLQKEPLHQARGLHVVEIAMAKEDAPPVLKSILDAQIAAEGN